jgi:A/G-specific adenine glycosylase
MASPTKNNIAELQGTLLEWFSLNGRDFPWRRRRLTHYQIVIAETLLQRTKAETVQRFYAKFIKEFPTWKSLAESELTTIEKYLFPIGLYRQRATRLKGLAKEMVLRNGRLPKARAALESIPFLGQYIANSIELIIFEQPSPLLDVNMARLLERYFGERKMADIRYDPYLQKLSLAVVSNNKSKELNWAILDFAALVCKAKRPLCDSCILAKKCKFYRSPKRFANN